MGNYSSQNRIEYLKRPTKFSFQFKNLFEKTRLVPLALVPLQDALLGSSKTLQLSCNEFQEKWEMQFTN